MTKTKHILITGGAGFIGSHLARRLINENFKVTVADNLSTGFSHNVPEEAEFIAIDLTEKTAVNKLPEVHYDAVFHLAGQSSGALSFQDPEWDLKSHVLTMYNLIHWCGTRDIKRILFSSSSTVYGDPLFLPITESHPLLPKMYYSAGKIAAEAYLNFFHSQGGEITIFRLPNVYGPGQNLSNKNQGMLSIYLSYILEGKPIVVKGSGERYRDFIYIDDVVEAWMAALHCRKTYGQTYNLCSGKQTTVNEVLASLKGAFGDNNYPVEFEAGTPGDQYGVVCSNEKLTNDIEWQPKVEVIDGIAKMVSMETGRNK